MCVVRNPAYVCTRLNEGLWWSQGCSIGCPYCLTDPHHPDNNGTIPTKAITGNAPHADKAGFRKSYCEKPSTKSILPKEYWTMNIHAEDGAEDDSYRYNPWRAPGHAPVVDPCGQAGGKYKQTPMGGASMFGTVVVPTAHGNITLTMYAALPHPHCVNAGTLVGCATPPPP